MASIQEAIKRLTWMFTSTGADKVADDLNKVGAAQANVAETAQVTEKASLSLVKSFDSLERRYVSTVRAQQDFAKVQDTVNAAVKQNPELLERGNVVLEAFRAKLDAAKGPATGFNAILEAGRGAALGYAAGIGPIGALLGSFGPLGIAAAAGIGIVVAAFDHMKEVAEKIGAESSGIKQFADTTGLTITQVRGLNDAGSSLGVTSDQMASSLQKFTFNLADARKGGGDLYDQLRVIDRQLADDVSNTHDSAQALDLLTKAYNSTTDATAKAAIARAAFGKGGAAVGPVLGALGDAGGVDAYSASVQKALGVTSEWTREVARLRDENKSLESDLKLIEGSIYVRETLNRQKEFLKTQIEIAKALRDAANLPGGAISQQRNPFVQETNRSAGIEPRTFPQGGDPVVDSGAIDKAKMATEGLAQAQRDNLDATIKMAAESSALVAALGSSATAAEKEQARIEALTVSFEAGKISAEAYERALNANPAIKAANDATKALQDQNELMKARSVEEQRSLATWQKYQQVLKETGDEFTAINASAATFDSFSNKIKEEQAQITQATADWRAAMLGVGSASEVVGANLSKILATQNQIDQATAAYNAKLMAAQGGSVFNPMTMPRGNLTFAADPLGGGGASYAGGGGGIHLDLGIAAARLLMLQAEQEKTGVSGAADNAYSTGGIAGGLAAITSAPNSLGISAAESMALYKGKVNAVGILGQERSNMDDKISTYDSLVGLQNAQTSDKGMQIDNLQKEMAWLNTLPETIARDQKIVSLQQSIDGLKNATDANTAATSATLNPLYSQGHGALAIGYYKAAGGLDMVAQGPTSGDQIPFHAMINGGERVQITPKGQSGNDNSRQVINNNNFVFNNASTSNARRSFRQFSQGFGQIAAAGS